MAAELCAGMLSIMLHNVGAQQASTSYGNVCHVCSQFDPVLMGALHGIRQCAWAFIYIMRSGGDPWHSAQRWALNWLVLMAVQCGYELRTRYLYRKTLRRSAQVSAVAAQLRLPGSCSGSTKDASAGASAAAFSSSATGSKVTTPQPAPRPSSNSPRQYSIHPTAAARQSDTQPVVTSTALTIARAGGGVRHHLPRPAKYRPVLGSTMVR